MTDGVNRLAFLLKNTDWNDVWTLGVLWELADEAGMILRLRLLRRISLIFQLRISEIGRFNLKIVFDMIIPRPKICYNLDRLSANREMNEI